MTTLLKVIIVLVAARVAAQQVRQNKSPSDSTAYTFSAKSQLVVETVVVKDKQDKFIQGLTAKDFVITEDSAPQKIAFCERQNVSSNSSPLPPSRPSSEELKLYKRLTRTQITPEAPDSERYKGHRLLAFYFDMSAMHPVDQLRAISAAQQFLRTQMTTADLVSILRYQGGSVDVLQDFTADRNKLLSILQTMIVGEGQGSLETIDDTSSADTGAAFGQDDSEFMSSTRIVSSPLCRRLLGCSAS